MGKDRRIYKHYYHMSFGNYMGVYVDEYLMKKLGVIQNQLRVEVLELLENNPEHFYEYTGWAIAEEPKELSQVGRVYHYVESQTHHANLKDRTKNMFNIIKIDDLYDFTDEEISSLPYEERRKIMDKTHTDYLLSVKDVLDLDLSKEQIEVIDNG